MDDKLREAAWRARERALAGIRAYSIARHAARINAMLDAYGFHWPHLQMMRGAAAEVIVGRRSGDATHHRRAVAEYFGARAPHMGREPGLAPWLAAFEADMCQISFGQTTRPAASTRP